MEQMKMLLLALLVVSTVSASPLNRVQSDSHESCMRRECPTEVNPQRRLPLSQGQTLTFEYVAGTITHIRGTDSEKSGLQLSMTVHIDAQSQCQARLRIADVEAKHRDPKTDRYVALDANDYKIPLEAREMVFTYLDGRVEGVCKSRADPEWVANIKRGILSALQLRLVEDDSSAETEKDVSGECQVTTERHATDATRLTKRKHLETCLGHSHATSALQSTTYHSAASSLQSLPITKRSSSCNFTVTAAEGRIRQIECLEEHLFRPFSNGENGVYTAVTQRMTFVKEQTTASSTRTPSLLSQFSASSLAFVPQGKSPNAPQSSVESVAQIFSRLCQLGERDVRPETPKLFTELVFHMRTLTAPQLKELHGAVKRGQICKTSLQKATSFLFDAVAVLGTEAGFEMMLDLIAQNQITEFEINLWLTGLSFLQEAPTKTMLATVLRLFESRSTTKSALFGMTSMVNRYCKERSGSCAQETEVKEIVKRIVTMTHFDCSVTTSRGKSEMIVLLKALGNVGFDVENLAQTLDTCAKETKNAIGIRVAALKAMQRLGCEVPRTPFFGLLSDTDLDTELRINAYLAIMKCPTTQALSHVKSVLEVEKVNQVGSFIWTHLTNLRETSDPMKLEIRDILQTTALKQEFDMDKLKFSRNMEKSFFLPEWNLGGQVESNLIWSQNSFLPRSASLNLTADLFGAAINFLEVEGRLEGAERILEKLLGPNGLLKEAKQAGVFPSPARYLVALKEVEGSLGVRIFGREVAFLDLTRGGEVDGRENPMEVLRNFAKGKKIDMQKNALLADSSFEIATIVGLPLALRLNVSSSVDLRYSAQFKFTEDSAAGFRLVNQFQPSGALTISAQMGISGRNGEYGVKHVTSVHTSSHVEATLLSDEQSGLKVEFNLPKEKQEIYSFQSEVYVLHRNEERDQRASLEELTSRIVCTGATVEEMAGVQVCASVSYPHIFTKKSDSPLFPLRGPVSAHLTLIKRDTHSGYLFALKAVTRSDNQRHYRWELNTPGSKTDRHFLAEFQLDDELPRLNMKWKNPWHSVGLEMSAESSAPRIRVEVNEREVLLLEGRTTNTMEQGQLSQQASVEFKAPMFLGQKSIRAALSHNVNGERRLLRAELLGIFKVPMEVEFSLTTVKPLNKASLFEKLDIKGKYSSHIARGELSGAFEFNSYTHKLDIKLKHQKVSLVEDKTRDDGQPFHMLVRHKWHGSLVGSRHRHEFNSKFLFGEAGEQHFAIATEVELSPRHVNVKSDVEVKITGMETQKITTGLYTGFVSENPASHALQIVGEIDYPQRNWNYRSKLLSEMKSKNLVGSFEIRRKGEQLVFGEVKWANKGARIFDSESTLVIDYFGKKISMKNTLREVSLMRFENDFSVTGINKELLILHTVYHSPSANTHRLSFGAKGSTLDNEMKGEFLVEADDLSKVVLRAEVLQVNTPTKFGVETTLRLTPGKDTMLGGSMVSIEWLEQTTKVWTPRFEGSESVKFAYTPNHLLTSLKTDWKWDGNSDPEAGNTIELLLEAKHDNTIPRKFLDSVSLRLQYPGRNSKIDFVSDFEYLSFKCELGIEMRKGHRITLATMYDINDGWTEKGIAASITLKTPYAGYENTHLVLNGLGQLRYQKISAEYHWGQGKRFVVELTVRPKSSKDFTSTLRIITPFTRMSYLGIHAKHFYDGKQITTEIRCDLGPTKQYGASFSAANKGDHRVQDIQGEIKLALSGLVQDISVKFTHRCDSKNFKTNLNAEWGSKQQLNLASEADFLLENYSLKTRGNVQLSTPWSEARTVKLEWDQMNSETSFSTNVHLSRNELALLSGTMKGGFTVNKPYKFNADFDFKISDRTQWSGSYDLSADTTIIKSSARISINDQDFYRHRWTATNRDGALKVDLICTSPFFFTEGSAHFQTAFNYKGPLYAFTSSLTLGEKEITLFKLESGLKYEQSRSGHLFDRMNTHLIFTSDRLSIRKFAATHKIDYFQGKYHVSMANQLNEADVLKYEATVDVNQKLHISCRVSSRFDALKSAEFSVEHIGTWQEFNCSNSFLFNEKFGFKSQLQRVAWRTLIGQGQIITPKWTRNISYRHQLHSAESLEQEFSLDLPEQKRIYYKAQLNTVGNSEFLFETPFREYLESARINVKVASDETMASAEETFVLKTIHRVNQITRKMKISKKGDFFDNQLTFKWADHQGDLSSSYKRNPMNGVHEFRLGASLNGRRGDFVSTIDLSALTDVTIMLKTPFEILSHFSGHFKLKGELREFYHSHSLKATIYGKNFLIDNVFSRRDRSFVEFKSRHECGHDDRFNYDVAYLHRFSPSRTTIQFHLEQRTIGKTAISIEMPRNRFLEFRLQSPIFYLQEAAFSVELAPAKYTARGTYRTMNKTFTAASNLEWSGWKSFDVALKLETPYKELPTIDMLVSHALTPNGHRCSAKMFDYEAKSNFAFEMENAQGRSTMKFDAGCWHKSQMESAWETRLEVSTETRHQRVNVVRAEIALDTPMPEFANVVALYEFDTKAQSYQIHGQLNKQRVVKLQVQLDEEAVFNVKRLEVELSIVPSWGPFLFKIGSSADTFTLELMNQFAGKIDMRLAMPSILNTDFLFTAPKFQNTKVVLTLNFVTKNGLTFELSNDKLSRKIKVDLQSELDGGSYTSVVQLEAPVKWIQQTQFSLNLNHASAENRYSVNSQLQSPLLATVIDLKGSLQYKWTQGRLTFASSFDYATPFSQFRSGSALIETKENRKFNIQIKSSQLAEPVYLTVDLVDANDGLQRFTVKSSSAFLKEVQFDVGQGGIFKGRATVNNSWKFDVDAKFARSGKFDASFNSPSTQFGNSKFESTWQVLSTRRASVDMTVKSDSWKEDSSLGLLWNADETLRLKLKTPVQTVRDAALAAEWSLISQKYAVSVNLNSVELLKSDVVMAGSQMEARLAFDIGQVRGKFEGKGKVDPTNGVFELETSGTVNQDAIKLQVACNSMRSINFLLETPFSGIKRVSIAGQFDGNTIDLKITSDGTLKLDVQVKGSHVRTRLQNVLVLSVSEKQIGTLKGKAELKYTESGFQASVKVTTPFHGFQSQAATVKREENRFVLLLSQSQLSRDIEARINLEGESAMAAISLMLLTPFTHLKSSEVAVSFDARLQGLWALKTVSMKSEEHGLWQLEHNMERAGKAINIACKLTTPLENLKETTFTLMYSADSTSSHDLKLAFESNRLGKYTLDTNVIVPKGNEVKATIKVSTPLKAWESSEALFGYKVTASELNFQLQMQANKAMHLDIESNCYFATRFVLGARVNAPHWIRPITINLQSSQTTKADIQFDGKNVLQADFSIVSENLVLSVKFVEEPNWRITVIPKSFSEVTVQVEKETQTIMTLSWSIQLKKTTDVTLSVDLNNKAVPYLYSKARVDFALNDRSLNFVSKINEMQPVKVEAKWTNFMLDAQVSTPFDNFQQNRVLVEFNLNDWRAFVGKLKFAVQAGPLRYDAKLEAKQMADEITQLVITLPNNEVKINFMGKRSEGELRSLISLNINNRNLFAINGHLKKQNNNFFVNFGFSKDEKAVLLVNSRFVLSWQYSSFNGQFQYYDQKFETDMKSEWDKVKSGELTFASSSNANDANRQVYRAGFMHQYVNNLGEFQLESRLHAMDQILSIVVKSDKRSVAECKLVTPLKWLSGTIYGKYDVRGAKTATAASIENDLLGRYTMTTEHQSGQSQLTTKLSLQSDAQKVLLFENDVQLSKTSILVKSTVSCLGKQAESEFKLEVFDKRSGKIRMVLKTPFDLLSSLILESSFTSVSFLRFTSTNQLQITVAEKPITFTAKMDTAEKLSIYMKVHDGTSDILVIHGHHRGHLRDFENRLSITCRRHGSHGYNVKGGFHPWFVGDVKAFSPLMQQQQMHLSSQRMQDGAELKYEVTYGKLEPIQLVLKKEDERASLHLRTPFKYLEDTEVEVTGGYANNDSPLRAVRLSTEGGLRFFKLSVEPTKKSNAVGGKMFLESSFIPHVKKLELEVNHEKVGDSEWRFLHAVRHDSGRFFEASGTGHLSDGGIQLNGELKTHLGGASLLLKHEHSQNGLMNEIRYTSPSLQLFQSLLTVRRERKRELLISHELNTPPAYLGVFHTTFEHKGTFDSHVQKFTLSRGKGVESKLFAYQSEMNWRNMRCRHHVEKPGFGSLLLEVRGHEGFVNVEVMNHRTGQKHFVHLVPVEQLRKDLPPAWRIETSWPTLKKVEFMIDLDRATQYRDLVSYLPKKAKLVLNDNQWFELSFDTVNRQSLRLHSSYWRLRNVEIKVKNTKEDKLIFLKYDRHEMQAAFQQGQGIYRGEISTSYPRPMSAKVVLQQGEDATKFTFQFLGREFEVDYLNNETQFECKLTSNVPDLARLSLKTTKSLSPLNVRVTVNEKSLELQMNVKLAPAKCELEADIRGDLFLMRPISLAASMEGRTKDSRRINLQLRSGTENLLAFEHLSDSLKSQRGGIYVITSIRSKWLASEIKIEKKWAISWSSSEKYFDAVLELTSPYAFMRAGQFGVHLEQDQNRIAANMNATVNGDAIHKAELQMQNNLKVIQLKVACRKHFELLWSEEAGKLQLSDISGRSPVHVEFENKNGRFVLRGSSQLPQLRNFFWSHFVTKKTDLPIYNVQAKLNDAEVLRLQFGVDFTRSKVQFDIESFAPIRSSVALLVKGQFSRGDLSEVNLLVMGQEPNGKKTSVLLHYENNQGQRTLRVGFNEKQIDVVVRRNIQPANKINELKVLLRVDKETNFFIIKSEATLQYVKISVKTPWRSMHIQKVRISSSSPFERFELCLDSDRSQESTFRVNSRVVGPVNGPRTTLELQVSYPGQTRASEVKVLKTETATEVEISATIQLTENVEDAWQFSLKAPSWERRSAGGQPWKVKAALTQKQRNFGVTVQCGVDTQSPIKAFIIGVNFQHGNSASRNYLFHVQMKPSMRDGLLHINAVTPHRSIKSEWTFTRGSNGDWQLEMSNVYGANRVVKASLLFNPEAPAVTVRLHPNVDKPEAFLQIEVGYKNDNEILAKIATDDTVYASGQLHLLSEHLLKSKLYLRKNLGSEFRQALQNVKQRIQKRLTSADPSALEAIFADSTKFLVAMHVNMPQEALKREVDLVLRDIERATSRIILAYRNNEFHLFDVISIFRNVVNKAKLQVAVTLRQASEIVSRGLETSWTFISTTCFNSCEAIIRAMKHIEQARLDFCKNIRLFFAGCAKNIGRGIHRVARAVFVHVERCFSKLNLYHLGEIRWLTESEQVQTLMRFLTSIYKQVISKVHQTVASTTYGLSLIPLESRTRDMLLQILTDIDVKVRGLLPRMRAIADSLRFYASNVISPNNVDHIGYMVREVLYNGRWFLENVYTLETLQDLIVQDYLGVMRYANHLLTRSWSDAVHVNKYRLVRSSDAVSNTIELQVYSPIAIKDLKSSPDFGAVKSAWKMLLPRNSSYRSQFWELVSSYYRPINTYGWNMPCSKFGGRKGRWPSFEEVASLSGDNVITFDKKHFTVASKCDYQLVQNKKAGETWSVSTEKARTVVVVTVADKTVKLGKNSRILVNEQAVDTPFYDGALSIVHYGRFVKLQQTEIGLRVTADLDNEIFTVGVSRWHHGKLAGLFGNMDSEPYNDYTTKDGRYTDDKSTFLNAWAIGSSCKADSRDMKLMAMATRKEKVLSCAYLFRCPLSPLASCFRQVDPKPFETLCRSDCATEGPECSTKKVCNAVKIYAAHCKMAKVMPKVPKVCQFCSVEGNENYDVTLESGHEANVVFVVEEGKCAASKTNEQINQMAHSLAASFVRRRIRRVTFSLVGYQSGLRPHSYTMNGHLFSSPPDFTLLTKAAKGRMMDGPSSFDPSSSANAALYYATKLPFTPTASKHIVLVPCQSCGSAYEPRLAQLLQDMEIDFNVLLPKGFSSRQDPSRRTVAMDATKVYFSRQPSGVPHHFQSEKRPVTDACYRLAMATSGTVFSKEASVGQMSSRFFEIFQTRISNKSQLQSSVTCFCGDSYGPERICRRSTGGVNGESRVL